MWFLRSQCLIFELNGLETSEWQTRCFYSESAVTHLPGKSRVFLVDLSLTCCGLLTAWLRPPVLWQRLDGVGVLVWSRIVTTKETGYRLQSAYHMWTQVSHWFTTKIRFLKRSKYFTTLYQLIQTKLHRWSQRECKSFKDFYKETHKHIPGVHSEKIKPTD